MPFAAYWWCVYLHAYCVYAKSYEERTDVQVFSLCFVHDFPLLYSMFILLHVCPPFLCLCVGVSTNRSVRWDAAESSCHSPMSKLAAFTFHFQSQERVWPEWSYHNVLSRCPVGHLTLHAHTLSLSHAANATTDLLYKASTETSFITYYHLVPNYFFKLKSSFLSVSSIQTQRMNLMTSCINQHFTSTWAHFHFKIGNRQKILKVNIENKHIKHTLNHH